MILGIGTDLVNIARMAAMLARFGDRLKTRCFTMSEQSQGGDNPRFYAKRFAAKEACAKALGTGIAGGILFRDIEVVNINTGAPSLVLHDKAQERLVKITPAGTTVRLFLSLSDEKDQALAMVVIEAI